LVPDKVRPALENTLKDLQLDYIDLYLVRNLNLWLSIVSTFLLLAENCTLRDNIVLILVELTCLLTMLSSSNLINPLHTEML